MWDVFVQAIGFIGIALNIIAVQFNKHWEIILFKTLGSALFVLQYILLEAWTGAAMDGIGILRNVIFIFTVKSGKPTFFWVIFFSVLTVILGAATFEGWVSFLAIGAKLLSCIAYGIDNPRTIRYLGLPTSMLWITYNSIHVSIAGVINELLVTASIIIAEIRFIEAVKKNKNKIKAKGEQENGIQSISERT